MQTLVVNIYGGPGAGKSTTALQLVAELKKRGLHSDYVPEYAKELVYAKKFDKLDGSLHNQQKVFNTQKKRLDLLIHNVDVAVTDSPLLLNIIYVKEKSQKFTNNVLRQHDQYNNLNIVIERDLSIEFESEGRIHNLTDSIKKDQEIMALLKERKIPFEQCNRNNISDIADMIICRINNLKYEKKTIINNKSNNPISQYCIFLSNNNSNNNFQIENEINEVENE